MVEAPLCFSRGELQDDAAYNIVSFEGAEPSTSKAGVEQVLQHFEDKTKKENQSSFKLF